MTIDRIACVVTQALNCHNFRNLRMWWKYPHQPFSIKTYPHRNDLTSRRRCAWNAWVLTLRLLGFSPQNSKCENIWNQFCDLSNTYSKTHVYYTQASKTLCRVPKNTYTKHVVFPLSLFLCGVCVCKKLYFLMLIYHVVLKHHNSGQIHIHLHLIMQCMPGSKHKCLVFHSMVHCLRPDTSAWLVCGSPQPISGWHPQVQLRKPNLSELSCNPLRFGKKWFVHELVCYQTRPLVRVHWHPMFEPQSLTQLNHQPSSDDWL